MVLEGAGVARCLEIVRHRKSRASRTAGRHGSSPPVIHRASAVLRSRPRPPQLTRSATPDSWGMERMKTPLLVVIVTAACATATVRQGTVSPAAQADSGRPSYTAADVHFVAGVIGHHPQALQMAGWGPPPGARAAGRVPFERLVVAQKDENAFAPRRLRRDHE